LQVSNRFPLSRYSLIVEQITLRFPSV
jgi:hypothetical protein